MLPAAVLAAVLSALSVPTPPDVEAARTGLARLVEAYADWPEARQLPECPLIDLDTINAALEAAGIDAPVVGWDFEITDVSGDPETGRAATCTGSSERTTEAGDPEIEMRLSVSDFGSPERFERFAVAAGVDVDDTLALSDLGPTVGVCRGATFCAEAWQRDGFAVMIDITDRVFVERPTTATVLVDIVPDVLAALSGEATDVADPLRAVDDAAAAAAAAGLGAFLESADAGEERFDCPAVDADDAEGALAVAGIDDGLDGWDGSTRVLDEDAATAVVCEGTAGSSELSVIAADLGDEAAAADFVASVGLADGGSALDLPPGDVTVGACLDGGAQGTFCTEWWWRDGLVVGVWLFGDASGSSTKDVLVELVPAVVASLGADAPA